MELSVVQEVATSPRVMIANDHATERDGLAALLGGERAVHLIGATGAREDEIGNLLEQRGPAVVVLDLPDPVEGGLELVRRIAGLPAHPRVVALRRNYSREQVTAAFDAGASGCVSTRAGTAELLGAVAAAQAGRTYLCPFVARALLESPSMPQAPTVGRQLTPRERQVLDLIAGGSTDREIAVSLALAVGTVHTHRKHIMAKLGVRNVTGLLRRARELRLLPMT